MGHGGVALLVLIDGLLLHRIPLRWSHYYLAVIPFQLCYVVWSLVHSLLTDIGNPNEADEARENNLPEYDDAIYGSLNWKDDALGGAITAFAAIFVGGPIVFTLLWILSVYPSRPYVTDPNDPTIPNTREKKGIELSNGGGHRATLADVEEGSIFARW
jgi:hypothetical protein